MANRYAVANGDWSNTATWDGGTLPTADDIVRPNGFNVTIDQDITVQALRNDAVAPAVAGGTFTLTGDFTVNISLDIQCFASDLFIYNGTGTAYITGTNLTAAIISSTTTNTTNTVTHSGTGHLIVDMVMNSALNTEINRTNLLISGGGILTCLKQVSVAVTPNPSLSGSQTILVSTTNGAVLNLKDVNSKSLAYCAIRCNAITTLNINGNVTVSNFAYQGGTSQISAIITNSSTIINITGNLLSDSILNGANMAYRILTINANSTITINGDLIGVQGNGHPNISSALILINSGTSNITINGSITGPVGGNFAGTIISNSTSTISITGNIIGGSSTLSTIVTSGNLNITGNITGGVSNGTTGVDMSGVGIFNHIGLCFAGIGGSAVRSQGLNNVTLTGPFLRNGNVVANACQAFTINTSSNPYFEFRKSDNTNVTYVDQATANFPVELDVREGTSYASNTLTGTLAVPTPDNVRKGVATDDTVGTADLTAEDFWNYLVSNGFASGSMGERMKNVSTVASTGAQIASYSV